MELTAPLVSILAGFLCGIISGFGIGGGSLLMVWMTAAASIAQPIAQGINLLYFIPTSVGALFFHIKNKMIAWNVVIPAVIFGAITAILGALAANMISISLLRKLFGGYLCLIGLKELFYKKAVDPK